METKVRIFSGSVQSVSNILNAFLKEKKENEPKYVITNTLQSTILKDKDLILTITVFYNEKA